MITVFYSMSSYVCETDESISALHSETLDEAVEEVCNTLGLNKSDFVSDGIVAIYEGE